MGNMDASSSPIIGKSRENEQSKHKPIDFTSPKKKTSRKSNSRSKSPGDRSKDEKDKNSEEEKENKEIPSIDYSSFKSARKVSLSRGKSNDGEKDSDKPKKKKWGNSGSKKPSIEISSESLKNIIPDVKPLSDSELHLGEESSPESGEASDIEGPQPPPRDVSHEDQDSSDESWKGKHKREVRELSLSPPRHKSKARKEEMEKPGRKVRVIEGPVPSSRPSIQPARNESSQVIYIQ